jgi:hypothetical protein
LQALIDHLRRCILRTEQERLGKYFQHDGNGASGHDPNSRSANGEADRVTVDERVVGAGHSRPLSKSGRILGEELGDWSIWSVVEASTKEISVYRAETVVRFAARR